MLSLSTSSKTTICLTVFVSLLIIIVATLLMNSQYTKSNVEPFANKFFYINKENLRESEYQSFQSENKSSCTTF